MRTLRTILIVLAAVVLVITAVIYFIDAPVVEEGQEPTVPQQIILLGKKYLSEILLVSGVSGVGLLGILTKLIYNSAKRTLMQSQNTSADVQILLEQRRQDRQEIAELKMEVKRLSRKQDIANSALLDTFALSDMPVSVREKIHVAREEYNGLTHSVYDENEGQETLGVAAVSSELEEERSINDEPAKEKATSGPNFS